MATPYQSIDPALLALQTAKKAMPASPSTQQKKKPVLQSNMQQSQAPFATSPVAPAKIGGISSPFGATNINSSPVLGGATPQEIGTTATQLQSLPKTMPDTGATTPDMTQSLKDLKATIPSMQSIDDIKGAFPEFSNLDDSVLLDLVETTKNSDNYEDILSVFPELQGGQQQLQGGGKAQFSPGGIEQFKPVMPTTPGFINPLKTLVNAPGSFANVGINYANMGLSPKETVKGLLKTIVGATNVVGSAIPKFVLGDEKYNEVNQKLLNDQGTLGQIRRYATEGGEQAKAVGEYFKGYGDLEELQRRIEEDPAGVLSDVATLMGIAGGTIAKVGKVSKLGKVAQIGQKIASLEKYDPYKFVPKATKEIGGKAISKVANIAGEGAVSLLGKATGTSADTIKEVYKAAAQGDTSAIEGIRGAINDEAVIENLKRGVQDIIDDRKTMYGKGYEVLKSNLTNVDTKPIAKKTLESLSDMGINFDAQGNLDFAGSTITSPQARSNLQNIVSDLYTRGDNTPKGLDILKQRVADYARYTPEFAKSDRIATMVSNLIKDEIVKVVPEYAEMTKGYSELSNLVKDIKQATGMGRKENISTIGTKLKGLLRDNQEVRKMVVQKMQEATGRNVLGQVAGLQMQPIMPRGLMGVGIAGGVALGQISSLINPTYLIPLLATSPRLIGEIANAMGVSKKFVTDYYNKFKSYASKYGNNTTDIMNNGGIMGNGLPNRADEVRVPPSSPGGNIAPVNNTPVIPPKATVAPSVSTPKKVVSKYIPGETDMSNYSLGEYRDLVKAQYPGIHTENDIQRMYKTLQDEGTVTKTPKKGMPKLGKETLEQDITTPYKNNYIAQYGASSNDINIDARKGILSDKVLGLSNQLKELPNFEGKTIRTSNSIFGKAIDKVNVGDILTDKGFLSSSKTKSKVRGGYGDYEIVIDGISGKDITKIKGKVYDKLEPEILFDRNTPFIVKKKIGNKVYIEEQANKKSLPPLPKKGK